MPRHPLPPFQKRRAVLMWAALTLSVLSGALWKTAQARRELIRQRLAWQVPEATNIISQARLSLSADGKRLSCYFPSKRIKYDEWRRTFDTHTGDVLEDGPAPTTAPSQSYLEAEVKSEKRNGTVAWLPKGNEDKLRHLHLKFKGHPSVALPSPFVFSRLNPVEGLHLSPDGTQLTVLGQKVLWRLDVKSQRVLGVVHPQGTKNGHWGAEWDDNFYESSRLSPDGKFIITLAPRPALYNAQTGRKLRSFGTKLESMCGSCACVEPATGFSPDGKLMWVGEESGGNVAFWRVSDGKKLWQHVFGDWEFDPTGKYVLSLGDGNLRNAANGRVVRHLKFTADFDPSAFSANGRQLYVLTESGRIRHYHLP